MNVSEVMAKSPAVCTPETPLQEVAHSMVEHDCGALPVVESQDNPRPVGVITDRDVVVRLVAEGKNPLEATAKDAMTEGVATVDPTMSLEACVDVMERNQVRRVPVVDTDGKVVGIVSQADIALTNSASQTAELLQAVSEEEELTQQIPMGGAYSG